MAGLLVMSLWVRVLSYEVGAVKGSTEIRKERKDTLKGVGLKTSFSGELQGLKQYYSNM